MATYNVVITALHGLAGYGTNTFAWNDGVWNVIQSPHAPYTNPPLSLSGYPGTVTSDNDGVVTPNSFTITVNDPSGALDGGAPFAVAAYYGSSGEIPFVGAYAPGSMSSSPVGSPSSGSSSRPSESPSASSSSPSASPSSSIGSSSAIPSSTSSSPSSRASSPSASSSSASPSSVSDSSSSASSVSGSPSSRSAIPGSSGASVSSSSPSRRNCCDSVWKPAKGLLVRR